MLIRSIPVIRPSLVTRPYPVIRPSLVTRPYPVIRRSREDDHPDTGDTSCETAVMTLATCSIDGHVATLRMADPHRLNALSEQMVLSLVEGMVAAQDARCRAVVICAEPGARTWSAGHDVNELPDDGRDPLMWSSPLERLLRTVRDAPFPVIASVEGGVWGGACDLVFTCDLVVATSSATFAITPAKLGVAYNAAGVSHFLGVLPQHVVKEMFFTAEPISAERAEQHGLVNRIAEPADTLPIETALLADRVVQMAPLVLQAVKAEIRALTDARPMTSDTFEQLTSVRRAAWRSADYAEGLAAFHEKRPPRFTGE